MRPTGVSAGTGTVVNTARPSAGGHRGGLLISLELLSLFCVIALLRLLLVPFSVGVTTVVVLWLVLAAASYLVGEFESTARVNYGLTIRTQAAFALAYVGYTGVHYLWSWCEPLTVRFWLALWFYLTFVASLVGIVLRRVVPQRVVLVTDFNQDKCGLLRWWGFDCVRLVMIEELEGWLKSNAGAVGRLSPWRMIIVDITDPRTEYLITGVAPRYFIDFIGVRSFRMSAYLFGPHPRPLGPFAGDGISWRLKRVIDILLALFGLLVFGVPMLIIALLIKLTSPGPVFYRHRRLGRNMEEFYLLKFRTMFQDADRMLEEILRSDPAKRAELEKTFKLKDDPRVTPIGKWLRRLSLDELPQLLNVLAGQMSIVGPRPIVEKEVAYYQSYSLLLFRVPPGLTGLWQVSGRTDTSYEERVRLDTRYVREWTLAGDVAIIFKTIPAVLSRRGAY